MARVVKLGKEIHGTGSYLNMVSVFSGLASLVGVGFLFVDL
jgi:hypothetical protein